MNLKLLVSVAKSLSLAHWKQTLIAAIGVTFSISAFIALLGFMTGLNDLLDGLVLNRTPHIRLFNEIHPSETQPIQLASEYKNAYHFISSVKPGNNRENIHNGIAIMRYLTNDQRVAGVTAVVKSPVFFNASTIDITGVLNCIEAEPSSRLFRFNEYIITGKADDIEKVPNSIILGISLAEKLLASPGDVIQVTTPEGEMLSLKVVGYFQSGINEIDKVQSYVSINTGRKLLGKSGSYITEIQIKLKDMSSAPMLSREYAMLFGCQSEDIQTANQEFETGSFIRTVIAYAVGVTLLIVAGFGIYNILNMMIYDKMDAIAILKATGFASLDVQMIFLLIALSIGVTGGLAGLMLGFGFSYLIDQIPFTTNSLPTVKTYPVNYTTALYVTGTLFSIVTTLIAGWLPSRKASKLDPVIIIRGK
ncbi:ABC transporter permease [Flavitalea antarctica]